MVKGIEHMNKKLFGTKIKVSNTNFVLGCLKKMEKLGFSDFAYTHVIIAAKFNNSKSLIMYTM